MEARTDQVAQPSTSEAATTEHSEYISNSDYEYSDVSQAHATLRKAYVERCKSINESQSNGTRTSMYMFPCPFCETMRPTRDLMTDHICEHLIDDESEEVPGNTCHICGRTLSSNLKLRMHLERHRAEALLEEMEEPTHNDKPKRKAVKKLVCQFCEKEFTDNGTYQSHVNSHIMTKPASPTSKWVCKRCKKVLPSAEAFRTHIYRHMMDSILRREAQRHHDELEQVSTKRSATPVDPLDNQPIKCRICETMCDNKQALSEHMDLHFQFPTPKKPGFKCPTCKRTHDTEKKQRMCIFHHKWRKAAEACADQPCWQTIHHGSNVAI